MSFVVSVRLHLTQSSRLLSSYDLHMHEADAPATGKLVAKCPVRNKLAYDHGVFETVGDATHAILGYVTAPCRLIHETWTELVETLDDATGESLHEFDVATMTRYSLVSPDWTPVRNPTRNDYQYTKIGERYPNGAVYVVDPRG